MNAITMKEKNIQKKERGFALLYTVLVISAMTLLLSGVYSLARKETILSITGNESVEAWYAADTGTECALYHLYKREPGLDSVECYGVKIPLVQNSFGQDVFYIKGDGSEKTCAQVITRKNMPVLIGTDSVLVNEIVSRGFSSCKKYESSPHYRPLAEDPYLTERRIRVRYNTTE